MNSQHSFLCWRRSCKYYNAALAYGGLALNVDANTEIDLTSGSENDIETNDKT